MGLRVGFLLGALVGLLVIDCGLEGRVGLRVGFLVGALVGLSVDTMGPKQEMNRLEDNKLGQGKR